MLDWRQNLHLWRRAYGSVDTCAGWTITTRFIHFPAMLPVFPRAAHLVMLGGEPGDEVPVTLSVKGVAIGLSRAWCPLLCLGLLLWVTRGSLSDTGGWPQVAGFAAVVVAGAASVASWKLGGLSVDQRAQRLAYARHAKYPVDVARLKGVHDLVLSRVEPLVTERATELLTSRNYRQASSPDAAWHEIAADPFVTDIEFLSAAFTRARINWHLATGPERRRLFGIHRAIWKNLRVVDPTLLQEATKA